MKKYLLLFLGTILLLGCNLDIPVSDITIMPEALTIYEEKSQSLSVIISPPDATNKSILWSTSNPSVAVIDELGTLRARSAGTATITARASGSDVKGSCDVTVLEKIRPSLKGLEGYKLKWSDEFDYIGVPDSRWDRVYFPAGAVNHEMQTYVDNDKVSIVSDGTLKITAYQFGNQILSARLHSIQLFQHGYFEARVKIPKGKGVWPAFWLMVNDAEWPLGGEVDILEAVGHMPTMVHSVVWAYKYRNNEYAVDYYLPTSRDEFHIYAAEITSEYVKIFVDNKLVNVLYNQHRGLEYYPYNDNMYMVVLNLAFGGDYGGAEGVDLNSLPATFEVDYVRVFTKE